MATKHISPTANEEPNSPIAEWSTGRPTLVHCETRYAVERTKIVFERGWERAKELILAAQSRARQTANESPLSLIVGVGIAAFGIGIALRIWRSNRYASDQFFGKWRT
jgi:hypothetical protein